MTEHTLYHRTAAAEEILRDGFRDGEGSYLFDSLTLRGVFVSDTPLDSTEGTNGDQLIEVTLPGEVNLDEFELVQEGMPYRQWCVPAELLNTCAHLHLLSEDEETDLPRHWNGEPNTP